jgi:Arc/MetJ family transcription regulator
LNAQHLQTNDARQCAHLHLKAVRGTCPQPPLCRGLCLRRLRWSFARRLALADSRMVTAYSPPSGFLSRRRGLPPPHPRFPQRSACLADGPLPRAATRLGLSCRRHAVAACYKFATLPNKRRSLVRTPSFENSTDAAPNPRSAEGCACDAVCWRLARRLALADSRMVAAV